MDKNKFKGIALLGTSIAGMVGASSEGAGAWSFFSKKETFQERITKNIRNTSLSTFEVNQIVAEIDKNTEDQPDDEKEKLTKETLRVASELEDLRIGVKESILYGEFNKRKENFKTRLQNLCENNSYQSSISNKKAKEIKGLIDKMESLESKIQFQFVYYIKNHMPRQLRWIDYGYEEQTEDEMINEGLLTGIEEFAKFDKDKCGGKVKTLMLRPNKLPKYSNEEKDKWFSYILKDSGGWVACDVKVLAKTKDEKDQNEEPEQQLIELWDQKNVWNLRRKLEESNKRSLEEKTYFALAIPEMICLIALTTRLIMQELNRIR